MSSGTTTRLYRTTSQRGAEADEPLSSQRPFPPPPGHRKPPAAPSALREKPPPPAQEPAETPSSPGHSLPPSALRVSFPSAAGHPLSVPSTPSAEGGRAVAPRRYLRPRREPRQARTAALPRRTLAPATPSLRGSAPARGERGFVP